MGRYVYTLTCDCVTHTSSDCHYLEDNSEGFRGPQHPPRATDTLNHYFIGSVKDSINEQKHSATNAASSIGVGKDGLRARK